MKNLKLLKKGLVVALLLTTFINTGLTANAAVLEDGVKYVVDRDSSRTDGVNYIKDASGKVITYNDASDFDKYDLWSDFQYNSGYDEDTFYVRSGVSAKDFIKIITCNAPSNMIEDQYRFKVKKNADNTMGVITTRLDEGDKITAISDKYASIKNEIITDNMNSYDKAKAIYDYIYDNITYSKTSKASVYDVLVNGKSANSDAIAVIAGNLMERATMVHKTVVGVSNGTYHYFNFVNSYVFDIAADKAANTKYEHFLTKNSDLKYSLGKLPNSSLLYRTEDWTK